MQRSGDWLSRMRARVAGLFGASDQGCREAEPDADPWPEEEPDEDSRTVPTSVRLVPQIPIRDQQAPRSWLGGRPRLPATMAWPEIDEVPCDFFAQIALADLPADLWYGSGPRDGWLAFFLHPTSRRHQLLFLPEIGPARNAPNPPDVKKGWYSPYGKRSEDALQERYLVPTLPEWPVDVVASLPGGTARDDGTWNDASSVLYRNGFDLADPAHHPFDWPGMQALVDCALTTLETRYGTEIPSPNRLEQQLAELDARLAAADRPDRAGRPSEPCTAEKIAETKNRAAMLRELIAVCDEDSRLGRAALAAVRPIAAEVHEQAGRLPFTPQQAESLLTRLQSIRWMKVTTKADPPRGPGAERIETLVLPITVHHPDAPLFAWKYHVLQFDMARHAYCRDIASLPAATRALYEPVWRDLGMRSAPQLGGFPRSHVRSFSLGVDVLVLELPSNDLMGWMFGDVDSLVLMMSREDITTSRFEDAVMRVGF